LNASPTTIRDEQRRRARRSAFIFALVALVVYAGFIWITVHRTRG
jgi:uncharacterized membrane protein (DUF485 family)